MAYKIILLLFLFFLFFPRIVSAQEATNSYVTIINPQRIAEYTKNPIDSFKAEYSEIKKRNLPATWPVTYDVLHNPEFVKELKAMDEGQEIGLFLEVTPKLTTDTGVIFNNSDSWHRATSLFLSGYTQKDREKLIDTYFEKFKKEFGYYPKSVGAWWVDAYSLNYMQKKYNITGVVGMSDQYDLDGYSLWGTWWSVPYYPSKLNAALPAQNKNNKLNVVTFRWAPREPLNGYHTTTTNLSYRHNSKITPSLFSLQDYKTIGLPDSYFSNLLEIYAVKKPYNEFGHAVIGLEGDLSPVDYSTYFADRLSILQNIQNSQNVEVLTMQDFSDWYMKTFPGLSPAHTIEAGDLLGETSKNAIWHQTPNYRIGLTHDSSTNKTEIVDLREYDANLTEPNFIEPNKLYNLSINLPFIIDSVILPNTTQSVDLGALTGTGLNKLTFEKGDVTFSNNKVVLPQQTFEFKNNSQPDAEGEIITDYSLTIPFFLKHRLPFPIEWIFGGVVLLGAIGILIFKKKMIITLIAGIFALAVLLSLLFPDIKFYISPTELDALNILKKLPQGQVLVYEKDCYNCKFETKYKPAAAAGKKSYVSKFSKKDVLVNYDFQIAKDSNAARQILKENGIKYVYLAKYGDSIEVLPYLPQDLGLSKVYENANAEIYQIKN